MARKLPEPINKDQFDKLIEYAKREREKYRKKRSKKLTAHGKRIDEYIIAMILGFYSGLRISEIVGLNNRVPSLNPDKIEGSWIRVKSGKGNKDRLTMKPKVLTQAMIKQLPLKVSRRSVQRFITKLGREALDKHITFHTLRHSFVTHCLEKGIQLHVVQSWAGHSRLDTTGLYIHILKPEKHLKEYEEAFR